jgi:hypothetical protein
MSSDPNMRLNSLWFKSFNLAPLVVLAANTTIFTAMYDKKHVTLNWTLQSDMNFSHCVVERSTDGKNYDAVALVSAKGIESEATPYSYKDVNAATATGVLYYRLRLVDKSAEVTYSPVRSIRIGKEEMQALTITAYPNPVADQLKVSLPHTWQNKRVLLELYNSTGIMVRRMVVPNASQTETLEMQSQSNGLYLVKATCEKSLAQQRVVKN